jgi:hypothetical protein
MIPGTGRQSRIFQPSQVEGGVPGPSRSIHLHTPLHITRERFFRARCLVGLVGRPISPCGQEPGDL